LFLQANQSSFFSFILFIRLIPADYFFCAQILLSSGRQRELNVNFLHAEFPLRFGKQLPREMHTFCLTEKNEKREHAKQEKTKREEERCS